MGLFVFASFLTSLKPKRQTTNRVLPAILVLCSLRRTFASIFKNVNWFDQRIGHDVPHSEWINIEIEMRSTQQAQYGRIHDVSTRDLGGGYSEKLDTGLWNMCHATCAPDLDAFFLGEMAATGKDSSLSYDPLLLLRFFPHDSKSSLIKLSLCGEDCTSFHVITYKSWPALLKLHRLDTMNLKSPSCFMMSGPGRSSH